MKSRPLSSASLSEIESSSHATKRLFRAFSERPCRRKSQTVEKRSRRSSTYGNANDKLRKIFGKKHSLGPEQREEEELALHHRKIRRKIVQYINSSSSPELPPLLPEYTGHLRPIVVKSNEERFPPQNDGVPLPPIPTTGPLVILQESPNDRESPPPCLNWQVFELRTKAKTKRELRRRTV